MSNLQKDAEQLVAQMTVEEVAKQLKFDAEAVDRLGIPAYNWWNEALHGVARAGTATVFPQAIGLAAMFDDALLFEIAEVIATEARAKYNAQSKENDRDIYKGLTLWSPNVNIFRDPRWGRGHETYGEDPYLTSRLGVAFIKGLQGKENYPACDSLKTAACAKHFAVHSGPEGERHFFNARASRKDMEETYLPAFEAAVREGKVEAVMGAYNRTNDEPCCASPSLMRRLRDDWSFAGHFVSDCWAIRDFHENHKITNTPSESAALALKEGCDLNCGNTYLCLLAALKEKRITEEELRCACVRLMKTRLKLGILPRTDKEAEDKTAVYDWISFLENDTAEHRDLALAAAQKSIVLLKNNGVLPLEEGEYPVIGIIGPNADSVAALEGNYCGTASEYVTNLAGIKRSTKGRVLYSVGAHLYKDKFSNIATHNDDRMGEALAVVRNSDLVILSVGLDATLEGEEGDTGNMFASGDKTHLALPDSQLRLCKKVLAAAREEQKRVIVVLNAGSALDVSFLDEEADALLMCWYSGEEGGQALADVLFGRVNPAGRLPVTFYKEGQLPDFKDYAMTGRTYRYFKGEPLYPFGYGLSYTTFETTAAAALTGERFAAASDYEALQKPIAEVTVTVKNTGAYDGEEVVLLYVDKRPDEKKSNGRNAEFADLLDADNQPIKSLCGFRRVFVKAGQEKTITIPVTAHSLTTVLEDGSRVLLSGAYMFLVGDEAVSVSLHNS